MRARGFKWGAIFDRTRGFFGVGEEKVLRQREAGVQRERVYMRNETWAEAGGRKTPRMDEIGSKDGTVNRASWSWKQKRRTDWKRLGARNGNGLVPRMDEKGSADGTVNRASQKRKYSPQETEKAH